MPVHAAGIYDDHSANFVSNYIISSYTPTLTALLSRPRAKTALFKMSVVIEPDAPGCSRLPGTEEELSRIRQWVPHTWLTVLSSPSIQKVAEHLQPSSLIHFACHGIQDLKNPLDSGLILSDGPLKVSNIMQKTNSAERPMSLAFLSACETAKGDSDTPDEVMHIAASLMFAGFHSVVGTMW
jgi:CHAT domain-containing protein